MANQKTKFKHNKKYSYNSCFIETLHRLRPSEHIKQYIVGLLLILTNLVIGAIMRNPKIMIFSTAFVITALVWIFAYLYAKQFDNANATEVITTNITKEKTPIPEPQKSTPKNLGGIVIKNSSFINNKVGISAPKDANIQMDTNNFEDNGKAVEIRDK